MNPQDACLALPIGIEEHYGIICTGETYNDKVKLTFERRLAQGAITPLQCHPRRQCEVRHKKTQRDRQTDIGSICAADIMMIATNMMRHIDAAADTEEIPNAFASAQTIGASDIGSHAGSAFTDANLSNAVSSDQSILTSPPSRTRRPSEPIT